jgi:hypothetical protein
MRYLDFLGGPAGIRAYLVPADLPRARFIAEHPELLDPVLAPIWDQGGVVVRQDASYPVPGFYVLSFEQHYPSIDAVPLGLNLASAAILAEVRRGMREALGIAWIHLHCEEKPDPSCNVHYWLLPVWPDAAGGVPPITRLALKPYLLQFRLAERRDVILAFNDAMRRHLQASDLAGVLARLPPDPR